ncbi:uncharacterized protein N7484_009328 [Penicillium longicatenatum]|uniref:uncharacterized protein n=1 Tax=Penicillium longicatenatum TaxID=1561947 RepID=UPI00254984F1|nr:uncharacterized protein N7484_009328 [Penicillium longicatenatum]KAJ5636015.1 hypothetical protein N7484_009328 [Penicillium longicatenatum]
MGLSAIFILGLLTFIFDIIRLVALIDLSTAGNDITYTQVSSSVWTCIEPAVGIIAACLSNMRPLFKLVHEKVWSRHASQGDTANTSQQEIVGEKRNWVQRTPSPNDQMTHSDSDYRTDSSSHHGIPA